MGIYIECIMRKCIYFVCLVFVVRTVSSQSTKNCLTPSSLDGVCKNINLCPSLQILNKEILKNSSAIEYFRNSICGFESKQYKVCCPLVGSTLSEINTTSPKSEIEMKIKDKPDEFTVNPPSESTNGQSIVWIRTEDSKCTTPDKLDGICINIQRCRLLDSMYATNNKNTSIFTFLTDSFCGHDGNYPKVCCPLESNYETVWSPHLPSQKTCGQSRTSKDKIVGGRPADLGAWPWIAALGYKSISSTQNIITWNCGGSLISNRYVLTAAHCTTGPALVTQKLEVVRLGDLNLKSTVNDSASPIDYAVVDIIIHAEYNTKTSVNDIALLKLNDTVIFTDLIQPICLPILSLIRDRNLVKSRPYVAGWGTVGFGYVSSDELLEAQVPVRDLEECKTLYAGQSNVIDERVLCAGEGEQDSCQGDSGGPLMWPKLPHFYLMGIVSVGVRCAEKEYPGVYTRVSAFIEWIVNNMDSS